MDGRSVFTAACLATATMAPTVWAQHREDTAMEVRHASSIEASNRALVESSFDAWRAGTGSPFDLLAENVAWTITGRSDASGTYTGREAFMREVIRPFNARMRGGLRPTIRKLYTDGDTVIIFFDASGIAADGERYVNTYAWFWEMQNGKVVVAHAFFDSLAFNALWRRVAPRLSP